VCVCDNVSVFKSLKLTARSVVNWRGNQNADVHEIITVAVY